jgi:hypothetical protein
MVCKINLYIDNNTGIIQKINWDQIKGDVEFNFVWLYDDKPKNAKNIIIYDGFGKCQSIMNSDRTITKIKFNNINNINLNIIIKSDFLVSLHP